MGQNGDFLPGSFAIGDVNSFIGTIDFQAGSFIQGTNAELGDEIFFTESIAGNSKDQANQPFHARVQMQKPSLAFARRGNFNNGSLAPISIAEIPKLVDLVINPVDNFAFPPRFRSGSSHALGGMPATPIRFPRHAAILPDLF